MIKPNLSIEGLSVFRVHLDCAIGILQGVAPTFLFELRHGAIGIQNTWILQGTIVFLANTICESENLKYYFDSSTIHAHLLVLP